MDASGRLTERHQPCQALRAIAEEIRAEANFERVERLAEREREGLDSRVVRLPGNWAVV